MSAVLFGSISTLADTSELQREAFNDAFAEHGLDWHWARDDYRDMLATSGGRDRIAAHARSVGASVDADAVHRTKSELFRRRLATAALEPRAGVLDTLAAARQRGDRIALVTTTSPDNVAALLAALSPAISHDTFDVITDVTTVERPKPDPAVYQYVLDQLGEQPAQATAVEDNADGVRSATAAGLRCIAFPNANTAGHEFPGAAATVDRLDPDLFRPADAR